MRSKTLRNAAVALGGLTVPVLIGVIGAAPASADTNDWCMSGPFGYAQACVDFPGWHVPDWPYGPHWGGGWHHGDGGHHGDHSAGD